MSSSSSSNAVEQTKSRPQRFVTLCGRIFRDADPRYFPRTEYRGRTIYFCTESCLGAFLTDPDIFYKVHRNSGKEEKDVAVR
jgi:YHS domain-containing protein